MPAEVSFDAGTVKQLNSTGEGGLLVFKGVGQRRVWVDVFRMPVCILRSRRVRAFELLHCSHSGFGRAWLIETLRPGHVAKPLMESLRSRLALAVTPAFLALLEWARWVMPAQAASLLRPTLGSILEVVKGQHQTRG